MLSVAVSHWISTLFCCPSVPVDLTWRVLDLFFSLGFEIILRVSLAILVVMEGELLSLPLIERRKGGNDFVDGHSVDGIDLFVLSYFEGFL